MKATKNCSRLFLHTLVYGTLEQDRIKTCASICVAISILSEISFLILLVCSWCRKMTHIWIIRTITWFIFCLKKVWFIVNIIFLQAWPETYFQVKNLLHRVHVTTLIYTTACIQLPTELNFRTSGFVFLLKKETCQISLMNEVEYNCIHLSAAHFEFPTSHKMTNKRQRPI